MNTQLVESLIQLISSLSEEEQNLLDKRLADRHATTFQTQIQGNTKNDDFLQPLIASGRIIPPRHSQDIVSLSEAEFREITRDIQIFGKPLSETVIEDRGEW